MQEKENPEQFDRHAGGYHIVDRSGLSRAGMPPFQAQTRLNGVIRQWLMRTFGRRLERTRPPPRVIRRASEFRLIIKSMR